MKPHYTILSAVVRSLIDKSLFRFLNDAIRQFDLAIETELANI